MVVLRPSGWYFTEARKYHAHWIPYIFTTQWPTTHGVVQLVWPSTTTCSIGQYYVAYEHGSHMGLAVA